MTVSLRLQAAPCGSAARWPPPREPAPSAVSGPARPGPGRRGVPAVRCGGCCPRSATKETACVLIGQGLVFCSGRAPMRRPAVAADGDGANVSGGGGGGAGRWLQKANGNRAVVFGKWLVERCGWPLARLPFCWRSLPIPIETPTVGRGGCSRMTSLADGAGTGSSSSPRGGACST